VIAVDECVDVVRRAIECQSDLVHLLRQQLQRVQVSARDLLPAVDNQDVVAQLLRLRENLRGEHDRPAIGDFLPQQLHDGTFEDRVHPGRELVEEDNRCVHHEHFRELHATAEPAAEILRLAACIRSQSENLEHVIRSTSHVGSREAVEPRERQQVVAHGQQQLRGLFLDHDDDARADVERVAHDVVAEDARGA
jgi:hypothetical protein